MKKIGIAFVGGLFILIIVFSLLLTPFVGAYHALTHPIETTVDFVTMMIGSVSDIFGDEEITVDDMDILISTFYDRTEHKELIDQVVLEYQEYIAVTPENLLKPFIFSHCDKITEENLKKVAEFISHNGNTFEADIMIEYMLNNSPFKDSLVKNEINGEMLEYLFNVNSEDLGSDYKPDESSPVAEKIVGYARSKLGCRYWWGANGPNYFDCSGFVYWTHNKAGIKVPRTTASGYSKMGKAIPYSKLQIGDVITFNYGSGVAHIGIYIGEGKMIHASGQGSGTVGQYPNQCVKISSVAKGSYFYRNMYNCRRLY